MLLVGGHLAFQWMTKTSDQVAALNGSKPLRMAVDRAARSRNRSHRYPSCAQQSVRFVIDLGWVKPCIRQCPGPVLEPCSSRREQRAIVTQDGISAQR